MLWAPIVTPSSTSTFEPIQTSSPTVIPREVCGWRNIGCSVTAVPWLNASIEVCAPIRTPSPMVIRPRTTENGLMVESDPRLISPVTYAWAAMYDRSPIRSASQNTAADSATYTSAARSTLPLDASWRCRSACLSRSAAVPRPGVLPGQEIESAYGVVRAW